LFRCIKAAIVLKEDCTKLKIIEGTRQMDRIFLRKITSILK